jgi:hypothetical protein
MRENDVQNRTVSILVIVEVIEKDTFTIAYMRENDFQNGDGECTSVVGAIFIDVSSRS